MKRRAILLLSVFATGLTVATSATGRTAGHDTLPQQVFDGMRGSFAANRARGVHAKFQFDLSGPNGGFWWIEVNDSKCRFGRGRIRDPGVTFIASDRDWVALSNGTLPGGWAYMTGRLKIRGDQKLAHKLDELFP